MRFLQKIAGLISDLRLAIGLLLLIAIASGVGTAIPQKESEAFYHQLYDPKPWLGLVHGDGVLGLQLDHIYSSSWFLGLLAWLALALLLCSWKRQWPALQAALRWVDYQSPRQLSKLSVAETIPSSEPNSSLGKLETLLQSQGWQVQKQEGRFAARKGVLGRVGPMLVHAGLVVFMLGAAWGSLAGQRSEQFLAPGRSLDLLDSRGKSQLVIAVDGFSVQRDPTGRPEQFTSKLRLLKGEEGPELKKAEISVNHPLRFQGITLYQADWALAAITVQLGKSPLLQLPLEAFPQLGEQIWGLVLPTRPDGSDPVLLSLNNEAGPVDVYGPDGNLITQIVPGGDPVEIQGLPIRVESVLPASGILLKKDPGVPLVYAGFAIALTGGGLSLLATRQLWAIGEGSGAGGRLHVAGLCNRNLTAFARELPQLIAQI